MEVAPVNAAMLASPLGVLASALAWVVMFPAVQLANPVGKVEKEVVPKFWDKGIVWAEGLVCPHAYLIKKTRHNKSRMCLLKGCFLLWGIVLVSSLLGQLIVWFVTFVIAIWRPTFWVDKVLVVLIFLRD